MKKIFTFLVLTFSLSSIFYILMISDGSMGERPILVFGLMWCPGISALITSLIFDGNLRSLGWRFGKGKHLLTSLFLPVVYASIPYTFVWILGLGKFVPENFQMGILVFISLGLLSSCLSALGEEIGWRGFLVPQLAKRMSYTKVSLLSGSIWALWHSPIVIFLDYNNGAPVWYSLLMFAIMAIGISFAFTWLRLRSGSLWTAVLLHASHNLFIQNYLDVVNEDLSFTKYLTSEFGCVLAISAIITAFVYWKLRHKLSVL